MKIFGAETYQDMLLVPQQALVTRQVQTLRMRDALALIHPLHHLHMYSYF